MSRRIPKFLRRLFRRQGGFNQEILDLGRFFMKEHRETKKRLGEIGAYLRAENGWFEGLVDALARLQRTLELRLANQGSFERRLLSLDDRVAQAKSESGRQLVLLEERLNGVVTEVDAQRIALDRESNIRETLGHGLREYLNGLSGALELGLQREDRARAALDERLRAQLARLDALSDTVGAMPASLVGEARARELAEERITAQNIRLDTLTETVQTLHANLVSEARAREAAEERVATQHIRLDSVTETVQALHANLVSESQGA